MSICNSCGCGSSEINGQSNCNCGCSQNLIASCVTSPCNNNCQCQPSQVATPTPYYNQGCGVQENHCQTIVQQQFVTGIVAINTFNMPACQQMVTLVVPGLQRIQIGGYLWNPSFGYLRIVSFDFQNSMVVAINECTDGNSPPGTTVPACTLFSVVDTPCCGPSFGPYSIYPFLSVDFVAPANGDCLDIAVTNVNGLVVGNAVTISDGTYTLDAIVSAHIITICNTGSGITPGTTVVATDSAGNYIQPVIPVNSNPCSNPEVSPGVVIVCKSGAMQGLDPNGANKLIVSVSGVNSDAHYQEICDIDWSSAFLVDNVSYLDGGLNPGAILNADGEYSISDESYVVFDNLTCRIAHVMVGLHHSVFGEFDDLADAADVIMELKCYRTTNIINVGDPWAAVLVNYANFKNYHAFSRAVSNRTQDYKHTQLWTISVPANKRLVVTIKTGIVMTDVNNSTTTLSYAVSSFANGLELLGVALG